MGLFSEVTPATTPCHPCPIIFCCIALLESKDIYTFLYFCMGHQWLADLSGAARIDIQVFYQTLLGTRGRSLSTQCHIKKTVLEEVLQFSEGAL